MVPPHCQILKDISKFSPPQPSICNLVRKLISQACFLPTSIRTHLLIVAAHLPEVASVHGKQSARHGGTVGGANLPWILAFSHLSLLLVLRQIYPVKVAVPLEATHLERLVAVGAVLEVIGVDHIDDWHQHTGARLFDPLQQWLAPALIGLAVGVQKDKHIPGGNAGSSQAGAYQAQAAE